MRFPTMWYVRPAKPQISLRIRAVWSEPLLVAWIFYECWATDWTPFGVSKLKRRLQRLIWVYTCQNVTLSEITCHGSFYIYSYLPISKYWTVLYLKTLLGKRSSIPRKCIKPRVCVWVGGGYSHFFQYVGLEPASPDYPQNIRNIRHTPNTFLYFSKPKSFNIMYIDLKKMS